MDWQRMSKVEAEALSNEWKSMNVNDFLDLMDSWKPRRMTEKNFLDLRRQLVKLDHDSDMSTYTSRSNYACDLKFAIGAYTIFGNHGMTDADASDDDIWRYIQMDLIPDVINNRWPGKDCSGINDDRMWRNSRRIWLKTLWWYVHLSKQDTMEETYEILKSNSSDDISQLIERSGCGYRIDLYRELMRQYAMHDHRNNLLRRVLRLNTATCGAIEPLLCRGGINEYVASLFDQLKEEVKSDCSRGYS